ncbi:CIC11C00000000787 [Sungouiella intermedia]|uniref:Uridylate kinase n=1 Tax=Sungouiella intermedia TaxID=45354 RepID=A0A1L0D2T6_9ASCO|nr:CIC11C00000000787 [[Candida] intermedia]
MFRQVKVASLARARPLPGRVSIQHVIRLQSTQSGSSSSGSKSTPPPPPPPQISRGKILAALGALAIGSTIFASVYNREAPVAAVEPKKGPAFSDKDVSVIFVLGGPGSGKGTQCAKLVADHGFVHLSAGDLLRAEQNREGSKYGELISDCIKEGTIVPQEVTVALLEQAIRENHQKGQNKFLVDGFPRKMDQAITFEDQIVKSKFTLFFECAEGVMLKRLLERGKTSGRTDDNIESIKKRFRTFVDTSMPVVDYFAEQGKVIKLQCDEPVDVVYGHVQEAMKQKGI